jgi:nucleotidyltransferase substrate binding protein (TIGR01987 family)
METNDAGTRWGRRLQGFGRALGQLRSALEGRALDEFSDLEREGIAQRFEYTFELGWKTLKDYLEFSGVAVAEATPRKVIKECAASNIFREAGMDPETYMDMMLTRNALSHTYDFGLFRQALAKIGAAYLAEFERQHAFFLSKGPAGDA